MNISNRQIALFRHLSDAECDLLINKALNLKKNPGEAVVLAGEPVAGIYVVLAGEVGVYPPGAKKPFSVLGPGTAFGEMSFLDNSKASATIRIEKPATEVACISHTLLQGFASSSPQIGSNLYRGVADSVAKKLRMTNEKISLEITAAHDNLMDAKFGKTLDGASVVEKLIDRTSSQMNSLSQKLESMAEIAAKLIKSVPDKATELNALGVELESINRTIKLTLTEFKTQMNSLHQFVSIVEQSIQH